MIKGVAHSEVSLSDTVELGDHSAFMVDADGVLNCKLAHDDSAAPLPVLAGVVYPMQLKLALSTSSSGVTKVYPIVTSG
jgi:hypothetical protein